MAPGRFHNSLSFGHKCTVCINSLLISHIDPSLRGQAVNQPSLLLTSAPHHCSSSLHPITAPHLCTSSSMSAPAQASPPCPQHPGRALKSGGVLQSLLHQTNHVQSKPFLQAHIHDVQPQLEGDRHECPKPTWPTSPLPGMFLPGEWHGCWWNPLSLAISCSKDVIGGINISAGFQRGFPSCHLVDKGEVFPFLFHRR